ncbi:Uncharacterized protein dnl_59450 [Desulfonema limicola]|uniref:Uncharacterized protein n=1 Tax=Desulfonema limicola TaxID=45656 RepID=A0A975GK75_9BACT|nr:hypothetical protein [Desulfonema limicola]QTA83533.1 Uncharacterized protein dnl_59450 [Desulfonema limicola]
MPFSIFKSIQRQAAVLDINDISQDCTLDIIKSARNASRIDSLIQMVEKSVISRKARSILIENGARLAANCLLEAEGALQLREDNASKKEYDFRVQAAEVETSLRKFRGNCAGIIHRLDTLTADEAIADDIWNRLNWYIYCSFRGFNCGLHAYHPAFLDKNNCCCCFSRQYYSYVFNKRND